MEIHNRLPKYHETFIPILKVLADGKIVHYGELERTVRDKYYSDLPQELLNLKTKAGQQLILNRIGWGKAYLKQAGMLHQPDRAMVQITNKGLTVLAKGELSLKDLLHDEQFISHRKYINNQIGKDGEDLDQSPQDLIDSGVQAIEAQVKTDLLAKLKTIDPYYFEKVVLLLLEKMGYGALEETPKSGDGGVDGIINQDKLGLDKIFIQAKRYRENKVREGDIRNFIGAMGRDTNKGVFVTTSAFDERALQKARDAAQKIITIDGQMLVDLMHAYGVGVQIKNTYEIKQVDEDFFEEE